jgi:hypothetical protein
MGSRVRVPLRSPKEIPAAQPLSHFRPFAENRPEPDLGPFLGPCMIIGNSAGAPRWCAVPRAAAVPRPPQNNALPTRAGRAVALPSYMAGATLAPHCTQHDRDSSAPDRGLPDPAFANIGAAGAVLLDGEKYHLPDDLAPPAGEALRALYRLS